MTQPLHYTAKAIEALSAHPCPGAPGAALGMRYLANKLREAQVFVLGDSGQLLDRSKPRPEVPNLLFKPPFPVVALEFAANPELWGESVYTAAKCSKRIALAWEWSDDLPAELAAWTAPDLGPGVVVASIPFFDEHGTWVPIGAAMHLAYDEDWRAAGGEASPFRQEAIATGRIKPGPSGTRAPTVRPVALAPEFLAHSAAHQGQAAAIDMLLADVMDEVNAYTDLCYALACKNVSTHEHPAPEALNRQRIKKGKLPLKGFHVLELSGGGDMPGAAGGGVDRAGPRSHLRRGHIRRLGDSRVTWVNSTVVRGRGFVDKVYAI